MLAVKKESSCFLADTLPGLVSAVIHKHRVTHTFRLLENIVPAALHLIPSADRTTLRAGSGEETKETSIIHWGGVNGSRALLLEDPAVTDRHGER